MFRIHVCSNTEKEGKVSEGDATDGSSVAVEGSIEGESSEERKRAQEILEPAWVAEHVVCDKASSGSHSTSLGFGSSTGSQTDGSKYGATES